MITFKQFLNENEYDNKKIVKALNKKKIDQSDWAVSERTAFQQAAFAAGLTWNSGDKKITNIQDNDYQYYFIKDNKIGMAQKEYFDSNPLKELSKKEVFKIIKL